MLSCGAELSEVAALIGAGTLTPVINRVFAFRAIGEAFALFKTGRVKGQVVVRMVESGLNRPRIA